MTKHCSSCGAFSSNEARFCRLCGAPFGAMPASDSSSGGNNRSDNVPVSPLAETVPLSDVGRATENLSQDDSRGGRAPDTSRVSRAEMEDLLHHPLSEATLERETKPHSAAPDARQNRVAARSPVDASSPPAATTRVAVPLTQSTKPVQKLAAQDSAGRRRRRWPVIAVALVLAALVGVGLLVWLYASRRDQPAAATNTAMNAANDARQTIDAQLAEATALLASNDVDGAIMRLREVVKLDPSNAPAHLKLAEALDRSGAHEEAISEYLAATKLDEQDSNAWSALAHAQFAANRFDDSAESYRRLSLLTNNANYGNDSQLEYAAALEHAGHTEEARALYLKISSAASDDAARQTAQQRLAGLDAPPAPSSPPVAINANNNQPNSLQRNARANVARQNNARQEAATNALPVPPSTSAQSSARLPFNVPPTAAGAAGSNGKRAALNDPDSYYIKGLSVLNQRDPKTLQRAEVVTALGYFQRAAQPGGTHRAAAQQLAERLGKELDKRRGVK